MCIFIPVPTQMNPTMPGRQRAGCGPLLRSSPARLFFVSSRFLIELSSQVVLLRAAAARCQLPAHKPHMTNWELVPFELRSCRRSVSPETHSHRHTLREGGRTYVHSLSQGSARASKHSGRVGFTNPTCLLGHLSHRQQMLGVWD